jgi:hypothetical protein
MNVEQNVWGSDLQRDALIAADVDPARSMKTAPQDGWMLVPALMPRSKPFARAILWWSGNSIDSAATKRGVGFKVLTGHGASIDTTILCP